MEIEIMRERAIAKMWNSKAGVAKIAELFNVGTLENIDKHAFSKNEKTRRNNTFLNSSVMATTMDMTITAETVQAEAGRMFGHKTAPKHEEILDQIIEHLQPIDFYEEANLEAGEKLTAKHQIVITVRQVLKAASGLNLGLCRNQAFLYSFNGEFWGLIEREDLERFLRKCADKLGVDKITANYHKFAGELYKQFLTLASKAKTVERDDTVVINLKNGTFEVTKNKFHLREFRREDFLTYQLDFDFDKSAAYPKWQEFLDKVLPDASCQDILAEYIGYVFARHLKLEKTMILFGTGANGKSVVFDVVNALLGQENVSNYSLESLCGEYYRAMIANKLLNYSSEISIRLQTEKFKQLTSGEPVEARLPYGQPMTLRKYARLAFNSNELPKDVEHNEAFFRRFLIIPFDVTIAEADRNPNLAKEIIETELSGVFNWVLEGLQRLLTQEKFSPCVAAQVLLNDYKKMSDSAAMFVEDENYQPSANYTTLRELYQEYKAYCSDNGYRALGRNKFSKRLEANGLPRQDRNQPVFYIEKMPRLSI